MENPPNILWTADDWGLSPGVNEGILELARLGGLKRVSVMANATGVNYLLSDLMETKVTLGLHFNLTYGTPLLGSHRVLANARGKFHSPRELFLMWNIPWLRRHLKREILAELDAQMLRLQSLGLKIEYLDSHHHIHLLPGLIHRMAPALKRHQISCVRLPLDRSLRGTRRRMIYWLARWNQSAFQKHAVKSLPFIYPTLEDLMSPQRIEALAKNGPVEAVVHPAKNMDFDELGITDSYRSGRLFEFESLKSFFQPQTQ